MTNILNSMEKINLFNVETIKKIWNELFSFNKNNLNFQLLDFWSWNGSDLLNNAMRWKLAEFIIAKALDIANSYRIEWDEYDLVYNGIKIEIKSWAYIQSWEQDRYSNIILSIKPTKDDNWYEFKRKSDIYVFAILSHKEAKTINPLKLEQWDFYIIKTSILNEKLWNQKTIGLNWLLKLNPIKCNFDQIKESINSIRHLN